MKSPYTSTLKLVSKGLTHIIDALGHLQNKNDAHSGPDQKTSGVTEEKPITLDPYTQRLADALHDAAQTYRATHHESKQQAEFERCADQLVTAMLSLAQTLVPHGARITHLPDDTDLIETLLSCCTHELQNAHELSKKTLSAAVATGFCNLLEAFAAQNIVVAADASIRYSPDMDCDYLYMSLEDYPVFIRAMQAHIAKLGGPEDALSNELIHTDKGRTNPFIRISAQTSSCRFQRASDMIPTTTIPFYTGFVVMHVRAPEGAGHTDYAALITRDQAHRLKHLYAAYALADHLDILDSANHWPPMPHISALQPMEPRLAKALDAMKSRCCARLDPNAFADRMVHTAFSAQLKDVLSVITLLFPCELTCDIERLEDCLNDCIDKARTTRSVPALTSLLVPILSEASHHGNALQTHELNLLEARARRDIETALKLKKYVSVAEQNQVESDTEKHFNELCEKHLDALRSYTVLTRYEPSRAHRVIRLSKSDVLKSDARNASMRALLRDSGLCTFDKAPSKRVNALSDACAEWSKRLPQDLVIAAFDFSLFDSSLDFYLTLLSPANAETLAQLLSRNNARSSLRLYCEGRQHAYSQTH